MSTPFAIEFATKTVYAYGRRCSLHSASLLHPAPPPHALAQNLPWRCTSTCWAPQPISGCEWDIDAFPAITLDLRPSNNDPPHDRPFRRVAGRDVCSSASPARVPSAPNPRRVMVGRRVGGSTRPTPARPMEIEIFWKHAGYRPWEST